MRIISSAPGRCGVVGNPTDMYGGSVISCSTVERARCVIETGGVDAITITAGEQTQSVRVESDLEKRGDHLDLARVAIKELGVLTGVGPFSLTTSTEIPMQAGLAGSTAMLTAIVGALLTMVDRRLSAHETAELVRKIEYESMGVVCGFQDAYMTVFGGLNYMDFRGKNSFDAPGDKTPLATIEPLGNCSQVIGVGLRPPSPQSWGNRTGFDPVEPEERLKPYVGSCIPVHLPIVLAHTGVKHHSGTVHSSPRERWRAGENAFVDGYAEVAELAREGKKAILRREWRRLGELVNRNHAIVRDLGGSGESNEKLIAAALEGTALGAKLAGAGGGGTILALTLDVDRTIESLLAAGADAILKPQPAAGLTVEVA